jgi:hypothetical protein
METLLNNCHGRHHFARRKLAGKHWGVRHGAEINRESVACRNPDCRTSSAMDRITVVLLFINFHKGGAPRLFKKLKKAIAATISDISNRKSNILLESPF